MRSGFCLSLSPGHFFPVLLVSYYSISAVEIEVRKWKIQHHKENGPCRNLRMHTGVAAAEPGRGKLWGQSLGGFSLDLFSGM